MSNLPLSSQNPQTQPSPAQTLLSGLAIRGKHMIMLGCGGLIVGILLCALSVYVIAYQF